LLRSNLGARGPRRSSGDTTRTVVVWGAIIFGTLLIGLTVGLILVAPRRDQGAG